MLEGQQEVVGPEEEGPQGGLEEGEDLSLHSGNQKEIASPKGCELGVQLGLGGGGRGEKGGIQGGV